VKSAAVLRLTRRMRQPWRSLGAGARLLPPPLLDWLYERVARNRYRLFGRYDACMVPDPALASRFVDGVSQRR
jgi:predicted DCC family thiol-disulfide oxidoreductase YuxK